jgi:hypothetical protein
MVNRLIPLSPITLAPTFQVAYLLTSKLRQQHTQINFLAFLDNLFLTMPLT